MLNSHKSIYNKSNLEEVGDMANQQQLNLLKEKNDNWNNWREQHPDIKINLSNTNLTAIDLIFTDLSKANLRGADLSGAEIHLSSLVGADLREAKLIGAKLIGTNLSDADLRGANLSGTSLMFADLSNARLRGVEFKEAIIGQTVFNNVDLHTVEGLDTIRHEKPSIIGKDTLERSEGNIPEVFLHGAGLPDFLITHVRSLIKYPIGYYTCFISYSNKDLNFTERLYADLQIKGIQC